MSRGGGGPLFAAADIFNGQFETGFDGLTDGSHSPPPKSGLHVFVSLDNTLAHSGAQSLKINWEPNPGADTATQTYADLLAPRDRVFAGFWFKLTAPISTVWKFMRHYEATLSSGRGGLFMKSGNQIFCCGFDAEGSATQIPLPLVEAQVIDGNWHLMEYDYWRNGDPSGFPSAAFWLDGNLLAQPDGPDSHGPTQFWSGGRLFAGSRGTSDQVRYIECFGTLNANGSTTGQINVDNWRISSTGRVGP